MHFVAIVTVQVEAGQCKRVFCKDTPSELYLTPTMGESVRRTVEGPEAMPKSSLSIDPNRAGPRPSRNKEIK